MICIVCGSQDFHVCYCPGDDLCTWEADINLIEIWCNTHQRDYRRCLKREGGIMLPCKPILCEDVGIEIWDEEECL